MPRIILFTGKGGVGKTTVSAATGLKCAKQGKKTIVVSLDSAHSLADSFDTGLDLYDMNKGAPVLIHENLWFQEIDIHEEIERNWGDIYKYFSVLLTNSGMDEVIAEELAVIPGMEDVVFLLYINKYITEGEFDVIILDCAPTGESLRFVSMPQTLDWYMHKVFNVERRFLKVARPVAKLFSDVPLPEDSYFKSIQDLYFRLKGIDKILLNKEITTVRLVTNAEKMVLRETERAFTYFSLFGMQIDCVIVNRLLPDNLDSNYFKKWKDIQNNYIDRIKSFFSPVPIKYMPVLDDEVTGLASLSNFSDTLYGNEDPSKILFKSMPVKFNRENGESSLEILMPGVKKEYIDLLKLGDELMIKVGNHKRFILLPRSLVKKEPTKAKIIDNKLCVFF